MTIQLSNAACQAIVGNNSNQGLGGYIGANAYFIFYTGGQALGGPETGTLPFGPLNSASSAPTVESWTDTGNGVLTANTIGNGTLNANGTATSWVLYTSGGSPVMSGNCGTSGKDMNFSTVSWTSGETVSITSFAINYNPH